MPAERALLDVTADPIDLSGVTVLVTRPEDQAGPLARKIREAGGEAIVAPTLAIAPLTAASSGVLTPPPDMLVFISRNAVTHGWPAVADLVTSGASQVAAVGLGTRAELNDRKVGSVIAPTLEFSSEGLLALPEFARERVKDRRIVIVRGQGGRETLKEALGKRGADVAYLEVYRRVIPDTDLAAVIGSAVPDVAVVSSAEGLANLADMIERQGLERLFDMVVVVPGSRVGAEVLGLGFTEDPVIADNPSDAGFLAALEHWSVGEL